MSCNCNTNDSNNASYICICDNFSHPEELNIGPGMNEIPRQIAGFAQFRRDMLRSIRKEDALKFWKARGEDDHGVMLLEMWAYVCDIISFYDSTIASEGFLRTAKLRSSQRKLVSLIGYYPKPAVAAFAKLAVRASGRAQVLLPAGMAFRSGSFNDSPPQIFELENDSIVHPFFNEWNIQAPKDYIIDAANPQTLMMLKHINVVENTFALLISPKTDQHTQALKIQSVVDINEIASQQVTFSTPTRLPVGTNLSGLRLMAPRQKA